MSDMTKVQFKAHMKKLTKVPADFTLAIKDEAFMSRKNAPKYLSYSYKSDTVEIRFDQLGSGHTLFLKDGTWLSFDRLGVEDSFYHYDVWGGSKKKYDLNQIFKEQLQRIEEQKQYYKTAIAVPGLPHTVSPERLAKMKLELAQGKQVRFMPSGFGTGYTLGRRAVGRYGEKAASKELKEFFGVAFLYISTVEMD